MKILVLSGLFLFAFSTLKSQSMDKGNFTFLALGDSYTIGEAVQVSQRWPVQLVDRLGEKGIIVERPKIIAVTGWTTNELQEGIEKEAVEGTFSMVSLLIGVNNQYRGYPIDQYEKEFTELLDQAIQFAAGESANVFVVSIPDYGVTPFAKEKGLDPDKIASELDQYNAMAKAIAEKRGVAFTDITPGSRLAAKDPSLVASDGLHPSGKMYSEWVDRLWDKVYHNLSSR